MYSQGDEDKILAGLLPETGRFLDIGAHDGRTFSNTLRLAEAGWSGVCVEPAPALAARLLATHAIHGEVQVVCAAIVPGKATWATFWDTETDCTSTLSTVHRDKWPDSTYAPLLVRTVPIGSLLKEVGYNFDFVSLDTEGSSVQLAQALPLMKMRSLKAVCVERDDQLELPGFERKWEDGNNVILARA